MTNQPPTTIYCDKYPGKVQRELWDAREAILLKLTTRPISNPVHVADMVKGIKINWGITTTDPQVRRFLAKLIENGHPIGCTVAGGYYWAVYRGDLQPSIDELIQRRAGLDARILTLRATDRLLPERI
jgi:ABC-type sulfate transport system permease subunit